MKANEKDIVASIFFGLIAIAGLIFTANLPPPSGTVVVGMDFLPRIIFILMVIIAVIIGIPAIYVRLKKDAVAAPSDSKKENHRKLRLNPVLLLALAILFSYTWLLRTVGFTIMSGLGMFAISILLMPSRTRKSVLIAAVVSIITPVFLNYVFTNFFFIMLPRGTLFF